MRTRPFLIALAIAPIGLAQTATFQEDLAFLKSHTEIIELTSQDGQGTIAIAPAFQGRVMTSSNQGPGGLSNGWLNRSAIAQDRPSENGNPYGGEDRLWIGPLGSQHSLYYQRIEPLSSSNWKVPKPFDFEPFTLTARSEDSATMEHELLLENFIGTRFAAKATRTIRLVERREASALLHAEIPKSIAYVGYDSTNVLTNIGPRRWSAETGLLSVWSLGMLQGSESSVVIIPLQPGATIENVNTYLGPLDADRLKIHQQCVLYKADGRHRSKVCVPPQFAKNVFGSYDTQANRLTLVQYKLGDDSRYFNSDPTHQANPYLGESVHIYNDGSMDHSPAERASFYELESSSPSLELAPREKVEHYHRVYHFTGAVQDLNTVANVILGLSLDSLPSW